MNKLLISRPLDRPFILMTGVTGLLGQYLLRDLLLSGQQLVLLVRSNKTSTAFQRVKSILRRWENDFGKHLPRPIVIEGDVTQPTLGLNKRQIRWLSENCNSLLHNAASLEFFGVDRAGEPWRTNVDGTKNVLELARRADISTMHYVSTAYVCGKRSQPVLENELDCGQTFRNDYEQSKFVAEQLVRAANHLASTTVYRPVVIAGDSQTGFTSSYHGIFHYLRLIATIVPMLRQDKIGPIETPINLPLDGEEPRNLVCVDWVAEVITYLICNPVAHGLTYHLSPEHCITTREFIDFCCDYFDTYGVKYVGRNASRVSDSEFAARLFENVKIYQDYETSDPHFDRTNLLRFAGHIPCPRIDQDTIRRFIEFGQAHRWGKVKPLPIGNAFEHAHSLLAGVSQL